MEMNFWYKKGVDLLNEIDRTKLSGNSVALWFLGQESMVIKSGEETIYMDPYFSEPLDDGGSPKRKFEKPFPPEEISHADWVFCTHNHSDHLDPYALKAIALASINSKFIVPAPHTQVLIDLGISQQRIIGAEAGVMLQLSDSIGVVPLPAAHEDYIKDENGNHLFLGYLINCNGIKIYHGGDGVEMPDTVDLLKPLNIDIACLPINGSDWKRKKKNIIGNMNAREAADVAAECRADLVIPMHFDLFPHNGENPAHFVDYMYSYYPARKFHVMVPGERFIYMK